MDSMPSNQYGRMVLLSIIFFLSALALYGAPFNGTVELIYSFNGINGEFPASYPISAGTRGVYGTTQSGGSNGYGTIYWITPEGQVSIVADLTEPYYDYIGSTQIFDGSLYYNSDYPATLVRFDTIINKMAGSLQLPLPPDQGIESFLLTSSATYVITSSASKHSFICTLYRLAGDKVAQLYQTDQCVAMYEGGSMVYLEESGSLYFSLNMGGSAGQGAIFKVDKKGNVTTIHEFEGYDGANPTKLVSGSEGYVYGVCANGGGYDSAGTLFSIDLTNDLFSTLVFFEADCPVPSYPGIDSWGNIVGVTHTGIFYYDVNNQKFQCLELPRGSFAFNVVPSLNGMVFGGAILNNSNDALFALNVTVAFMEVGSDDGKLR